MPDLIDEDYFAWSDATATGLQVNTSELHGVPGCPHCGNAKARLPVLMRKIAVH
ncbi:TerY-C metal binding domain-containing protein [Escherichia coli]